jgi:hypothetical protein
MNYANSDRENQALVAVNKNCERLMVLTHQFLRQIVVARGRKVPYKCGVTPATLSATHNEVAPGNSVLLLYTGWAVYHFSNCFGFSKHFSVAGHGQEKPTLWLCP